MTQYNTLSSSYDVLDTLPYRTMEAYNVSQVIDALLKPELRVLELACGTGFYTSKFLERGVAYMAAVDLSHAMLSQAAHRLHHHVSTSHLRLIQGDGSELQPLAPDASFGYFDMAFGAWFLNYAEDKARLVAMFRNVSRNIRPGAPFIGIVPHPTDELHRRAETLHAPPFDRMFPRNVYSGELDSGDGYGLHVFLNNNGVDFTTWHMKREVYEDAARLGGFRGPLEWKHEVLLDDAWKQNYDLTPDEWKIREANPHFGILIAWN